MKKLYVFVLSIMLILSSSLLFTGCGGDAQNGFVEVQSIEYFVNNRSTRIYSKMNLVLTEIEEITSEEFLSIENKININSYYKDTEINIHKSNIPYTKPTGTLCYIENNTYYKAILSDIITQYVSVKIISDRLIKINAYDNVIQDISTDNFIITYFK